VRLGRVRRRWMAFPKLTSFRGFFLWAEVLSVSSDAVSDLDPMRASVCDAFLRSRPVSTVNRSSANMRPSSVTRTGVDCGATDSNDMVVSMVGTLIFVPCVYRVWAGVFYADAFLSFGNTDFCAVCV